MRPTTYNLEIAQEICDVISTTSKGLKTLSREIEHWPDATTIYAWIMRHEEFAKQYLTARQLQAQIFVDEVIEICDDVSKDWRKDKDGNDVVDHDHISRAALKINTRKWVACKLIPRIYGDKTQTEMSGSLGVHEVSLSELK